jgi:hypothetical protein
MATAFLQTEDIAFAVYDALVLRLPDILREVQDRRNNQGRQVITLAPFATITLGYDVASLSREISTFPRIDILSGPRQADTRPTNNMYADATHTLVIEWTAIATDQQSVAVAAWRYGEAVLKTLVTSGQFAGFEPTSLLPNISEATPVPYEGESQPFLRETYWTCTQQAQLGVRGRYILA